MSEERELGRAEARAFRLLTRRAHSEKELRVKLRKGGFSAAVVEETARRCRELGYMNDEAFAGQRARVLAVHRLQGDRRIAVDLRERGIGEELCQRAIEGVRGELGEDEAAMRLLRKKLRGRPAGALGEREKARLARGLMGKGFPTGLILKALKKTEEEGFHDDERE